MNHHHQALASSSSIISPSSSSSPANTPIAGIIEKQEPNTTTPALSSVAVLVGSLVSSPSIYTDLHQHRSMYFAFPDLSVRLVGQYRLQFTLFSLGRYVRVYTWCGLRLFAFSFLVSHCPTRDDLWIDIGTNLSCISLY